METLGHFPATFLATKIGYFEGGVASLDSWLCVGESMFGHFQAVFAAKKLKTFSYDSGNKTRHSQWSVKTFSSHAWSKNDVPLALTKRILCLNLIRPLSFNISGLQNRTLPTSITVIVLKISINLDSSTTQCITSGAGMDGEHGWRTYAAKNERDRVESELLPRSKLIVLSHAVRRREERSDECWVMTHTHAHTHLQSEGIISDWHTDLSRLEQGWKTEEGEEVVTPTSRD